MEGDSYIIINALTQLYKVIQHEKLSNHWRFTSALENIQLMIKDLHASMSRHVHRKENKLANIMANEGLGLTKGDLETTYAKHEI